MTRINMYEERKMTIRIENLNICIVVPVFCNETYIKSKKRARKRTLRGFSGLIHLLQTSWN